MTRILIVDDHLLFADGLKSIFTKTDNYDIVGIAHDAKTTFQLLEKTPIDILPRK